MIVNCERPWLSADLGAPHRVLSWAPHKGGITTASRILWREVRNADLPEGFDIAPWLSAELVARQAQDTVCLLTSRDVTSHVFTRAEVEGITVEALTTAGLSNAESVGARRDWQAMDWGTINIAVQIHARLTETALIEALSIATQARTAAVIDCALHLPTGIATGTGTDCIALAALPGTDHPHAGLHTAVGEAVGAAVRRGVAQAAGEWVRYWEALGRMKPGRGL